MNGAVRTDPLSGTDGLVTLRNVVKYPGVTCGACGEPTTGETYCRHCAAHRRIPGTAELVLPIVYAVAGERLAFLLRRYKDRPARAVRRQAERLIGSLVDEMLARHSRCIDTTTGIPVTVRTTVPSLTFRPGVHPLARIVSQTGFDVTDVLSPRPTATCHRVVADDKFEVLDRPVIEKRHVLLIDDVWTTGSTAQSAALALRCAGASAVTVMVVGRWINPEYPPAARFLATRGLTAFDPVSCPVTGDSCPSSR